MKTKLFAFIALVGTASAFAQGTMYSYDQQSSTNETPLPGTGPAMQLIRPPWGQSFMPSLGSVDFIRLKFSDADTGDGYGATVFINLTDSLSGAVLGTTAAVTMPNNFAGTTTFLFPASIPLTPGRTYYIEPMLVGSANWNIDISEYNYPGGSSFANGLAGAGDLWFREGIIVPEPSSLALLLVSAGALFCWRRRK